MTSSYRKFTFTTAQPDILLAFLADWPFAAFEEEEGAVHAYLHTEFEDERVEREVRSACSKFFASLEVSRVPDINWNAQWEASFEPIAIGDFCHIRASFHPASKDTRHEIVIDPKMSFGTGHHATTKMIIEQMSGLDLNGRSVLDMGCGTGILAILAHKMGADYVLAVDIDDNCIVNSRENFALNGAGVELLQGGAEVLPDHEFDFILANINRNALRGMLGDLKERLATKGLLILSGILDSDAAGFIEYAQNVGLMCHKRIAGDEWACLALQADL